MHADTPSAEGSGKDRGGMTIQTGSSTMHRIERLQLRGFTGMSTGTLLLWLCLLWPGVAAAAEDDWVRVADAALKAHGWRPADHARYAATRLDANGDGVMDEAYLVESRDRRRTAVRICLGTRPGAAAARCYIAAAEEGDASAMGVDRRAPGCHAYTGNTHDAVTDSTVCTPNASVEYFRMASAGSLLVYDRRTDDFQRFWYAD